MAATLHSASAGDGGPAHPRIRDGASGARARGGAVARGGGGGDDGEEEEGKHAPASLRASAERMWARALAGGESSSEDEGGVVWRPSRAQGQGQGHRPPWPRGKSAGAAGDSVLLAQARRVWEAIRRREEHAPGERRAPAD
jgi:hypothetical protein